MSSRFHGFGRPREDEPAAGYIMAFPLGDRSDELDEQGIPRPPARALFCCLRDGPPCEWCPSNPNQREEGP